MTTIDLKAVKDAMEWARKAFSERRILEGAMNSMEFGKSNLENELTVQIEFLTAHLALSEYDRAVSDLAKYLPDGWVAQDLDGDMYLYKNQPPLLDGYWSAKGDIIAKVFDGEIAPVEDDWRTSLRRIESGKVVTP